MIEPVDVMNFLKSALLVIGVILVFQYLFPPLYLINDKNRAAKEKKLTHILNLDNMNWKQKTKMFSIMLLGCIFTYISFLIHN